jgi:hypothetical protein
LQLLNLDKYLKEKGLNLNPFLQSFRKQNKDNSTNGKEAVYLAYKQDWIMQGMGRCIFVIEQRDLPGKIWGMRITSHDNEHECFRIHTLVNSSQHRRADLNNHTLQELAVMHELSYVITTLSSTAKTKPEILKKLYKNHFQKYIPLRLKKDHIINYIPPFYNKPFVPVKDKKFVSIGKMSFKANFERTFPPLHYMVDNTASGNFEATLLEFGLVSWSEAEEEAIISLAKQTHFHINAVMEKDNLERFIEEDYHDAMSDYWRYYRKIKYLQHNSKDLSTEKENRLKEGIKAILAEKISEKSETASNKVFSLTFSNIIYTEVSS